MVFGTNYTCQQFIIHTGLPNNFDYGKLRKLLNLNHTCSVKTSNHTITGYLRLRLITQEKNGMRPALITLVYGGICVFLFLLNFFFSHDDYLLEITNPIGFVVIFCFVAWIICILIGQQKQVERVRGILEWVPNRIIYVSSINRFFYLQVILLQLQCNIWLFWNI